MGSSPTVHLLLILSVLLGRHEVQVSHHGLFLRIVFHGGFPLLSVHLKMLRLRLGLDRHDMLHDLAHHGLKLLILLRQHLVNVLHEDMLNLRLEIAWVLTGPRQDRRCSLCHWICSRLRAAASACSLGT